MDQLIPGVQQGQRLTLSGVSDRIGRVEEIVAKLAEDFYGTPDTPITQAEVEKVAIQPSSFVDGGCTSPWFDQSDRIDALERENAGLRAQVEHLREQRDQVNPILELKDARIMELEAQVLRLTHERGELEAQVADLETDRDYWHSEFLRGDDEISEIRAKLAGLI